MLVRLQQRELIEVADAAPPSMTLGSADSLDALVPRLDELAVIAIEFSGPSEGRGYSQARALRERYGFRGELRAVGHVKRDQLLFMARCGFDAFELAPGETLTAAREALSRFTVTYTQLPTATPLPSRFAARG